MTREIVHVGPADTLIEQMKHFISVIRDEDTPLVDGQDATRTLEVTLALAQSASAGHRTEPLSASIASAANPKSRRARDDHRRRRRAGAS